MSNAIGPVDPAALEQLIRELGLGTFVEQMGHLQDSLGKVAQGMEHLGESAMRQSQDTENLAAHILAIEAVLSVVLRHIPIDRNEMRREAERRTRHMDKGDAGTPSVVVRLAEDLVAHVDD